MARLLFISSTLRSNVSRVRSQIAAHSAVCSALAAKGQEAAAIAAWKKVLELDPSDAKAHNNLGLHLLQQGGLDAAITHFQKAVELSPEYGNAESNLGIALLQKGRFDAAVAHLQKALDINPTQAQNHLNLGNAFYMQGKISEALTNWRAGLRVEPNHLALLSQTAWVLATCPRASVRNGTEAVELARRAVQASGGKDPAILDTLAAAYAEAGRFAEAVETIRQALALATQQNAQPLIEGLKARMALYEAKTPFRETP
jgi:spermidine synthase